MMRNFKLPIVGKTLSGAVLMLILLVAPSLIASSHNSSAHIENTVESPAVVETRAADETAAVIAEAGVLYDEMGLEAKGLPKSAFEYAFRGFRNLVERGMATRNDVLTVADFSQSSRSKRLFIIDVADHKVLMQTYVAHGRNSGEEYASSFSNSVDSHKSSLGFYVTRNTYMGQHGLSLKLEGLDRGFNDNAADRAIVVHGANYIGSDALKGRSWGCPAVASKLSKKVIQTIKDGSVLFIYYPSSSYLSNSRILNG